MQHVYVENTTWEYDPNSYEYMEESYDPQVVYLANPIISTFSPKPMSIIMPR